MQAPGPYYPISPGYPGYARPRPQRDTESSSAWIWVVVGIIIVAALVYFLVFSGASASGGGGTGSSPVTPSGPSGPDGPATVTGGCVIAGAWGTWSGCSQPCEGGLQFRIRPGNSSCTVQDLVQSRSCNSGIPCDVDCIPGNPANAVFSGCPSCAPPGGAFQFALVPPIQQASGGGRDCPIEDILIVQSCTGLPQCPPDVDCTISSATVWSECSAPCGGGIQVGVNPVLVPQSGSGRSCPCEEVVLTRTCNTQTCTEVDCDKIVWPSSWSQCSVPCGVGFQWQSRTPGPGDQCPTFRTQSCTMSTCPTNCAGVASWDKVLQLCYEECLGMQPNWTVSGCDLSALKTQVCGGSGCPAPVGCQYGDWSPWSSCSVPCSQANPYGGIQTRSRPVLSQPLFGGAACDADETLQTQTCNALMGPSVSCFPINCSLSQWTPVGSCSKLCGGGFHTLQRTISVQPQNGGQPCPTVASAYLSTSACNTQTCVDCQFSNISAAQVPEAEWSECSAPCGGVRTFVLPIAQPAGPGGKPCLPQDGIIEQTCTQCGPSCPLGLNNQVCSGRGTCSNGTCSCNAPFQGTACGFECPVGPNGQVCSGRGTCVNGKCQCSPGISGTYCEQGGFCEIQTSYFNPAQCGPTIIGTPDRFTGQPILPSWNGKCPYGMSAPMPMTIWAQLGPSFGASDCLGLPRTSKGDWIQSSQLVTTQSAKTPMTLNPGAPWSSQPGASKAPGQGSCAGQTLGQILGVYNPALGTSPSIVAEATPITQAVGNMSAFGVVPPNLVFSGMAYGLMNGWQVTGGACQ